MGSCYTDDHISGDHSNMDIPTGEPVSHRSRGRGGGRLKLILI